MRLSHPELGGTVLHLHPAAEEDTGDRPSCCRGNYSFYFNPYSKAAAWAVSQSADMFGSIPHYSTLTGLGFSEESCWVLICPMLFQKKKKLSKIVEYMYKYWE